MRSFLFWTAVSIACGFMSLVIWVLYPEFDREEEAEPNGIPYGW
jgi:hypothetical protein